MVGSARKVATAANSLGVGVAADGRAGDRHGFANTRYGPRPGNPGYEAPVRHLPGEKQPAG